MADQSLDGEEEDESPSVTSVLEDGEGWRPSPRGLERLDLVDAYLPEEDEWEAKTILDVGDPARVAALDVFDRLFPSCAHQQDIRSRFVEMWMKSRISRSIKDDGYTQGQSRKDFKELLMATFGQGPEEKNANKFFSALAADLYDDDD